LIEPLNNAKDLIAAGERYLVKKHILQKNNLVVIVTGLALKSGSTNLIKLHRVGKND
jgi:pyruvate kinase